MSFSNSKKGFHPYSRDDPSKTPSTSFSSSKSPALGSSIGFSRHQKPPEFNDIMENLDNVLRTSTSSPSRLFRDSTSNRPTSSHQPQQDITTVTPDVLRRSVMHSGTSNIFTAKDAELMKARIEIRELKRMLIESKNEYEHRVLELEKKNSILEVVQEEQKSKLAKADSNVAMLFKENKELEKKLASATEEYKLKVEECEDNISELQRENIEMKEQSSQLLEENDDFNSQLDHMTRQKDSKILSMRSQIDKMAKMLREELAKKVELEGRVSILESELDQKNREMETAATSETNDLLSKQFKDQVTYIKQLEGSNQELSKEIAYLRLTKENVERLKEEKASLMNQIENVSMLRGKLGEAEAELSLLRAEKKNWSGFLEKEDCVGFESPYALSKSLAKERFELAVLKEKSGNEAANQKGMKAYIEQMENELSEERKEHAASASKYEGLLRAHKRTERNRDLLQKEVQFLRDQLKSYEVEEEEMSTNFDRVKTERIHQLEKVVDMYRSRISELDLELQAAGKPESDRLVPEPKSIYSRQAIERIEALEAEISSLTKEKWLLEKELKSVMEQAALLESAIGRGVCDTTNVRILQLSDNPQSQDYKIKRSMLEALQKENFDLRSQLSSSAIHENLIPVASLRPLQLECEEARRQIEEKEKRIVRLKEVYAAKAQEYREAVFSLVGYKVDFQEGRVKLVSTYADREDPSFLFTSGPNDEGTMQLVGGSQERLHMLQPYRQYFIDERGSVPAFLSLVTMEGWKRRNNVTEQT
ncbi:coiled-coil domain-containing protein mad1 [Dinochytrium kinnereticum]|nr:coiled-coil domain-containing protein mad1 [Dinochytrium kinnereticum]